MDDVKVTISKNRYSIWLYALALLLPFVVSSFEVNAILALLFFAFILLADRFKLSQNLLTSLLLILIIFLISFSSQFLHDNQLYDIIKDSIYLIKPFIYLSLGYLLATRIKNKDDVFKIIIYLGIILATVHVFKVVYFLIDSQEYQINRIRSIGGKDNFLELLACALLFLNKKNKFFNLALRYKKTAYIILALSFIFYFSRTMFVAFFILVLTVNGYLKLSRRAIIAIVSLIISVGLFYKVLYSYDIERGAEGIEGFLYKVKIAPSEIFSADINLKDPTERWDHWRAFEAKKSFDTMNETGGVSSYVIGMGLGSLIDLGFEADLGVENMQYIPKIHNGYVYIIFKAGFLGLLVYLLFLLNLYLSSYLRIRNDQQRFINNFISAIAIFYLFTSFIISGIYNPKDIYTIFLGALLSLQAYYRKIE